MANFTLTRNLLQFPHCLTTTDKAIPTYMPSTHFPISFFIFIFHSCTQSKWVDTFAQRHVTNGIQHHTNANICDEYCRAVDSQRKAPKEDHTLIR